LRDAAAQARLPSENKPRQPPKKTVSASYRRDLRSCAIDLLFFSGHIGKMVSKILAKVNPWRFSSSCAVVQVRGLTRSKGATRKSCNPAITRTQASG